MSTQIDASLDPPPYSHILKSNEQLNRSQTRYHVTKIIIRIKQDIIPNMHVHIVIE